MLLFAFILLALFIIFDLIILFLIKKKTDEQNDASDLLALLQGFGGAAWSLGFLSGFGWGMPLRFLYPIIAIGRIVGIIIIVLSYMSLEDKTYFTVD